MHLILLNVELLKISPEVKFFLVRFVQLYGLIEPVRLGVKELSKATGTTDRVVSHSLDELVATEFLNRREIENGARGRKRREYQCSSRLITLLEGHSKNTASLHGQKIDRVLHGASQQDESELNINNRLLLSVLLSHADQFGVVRHLGLSDLSKRTGLNRERIKAQLHKLYILRKIRSSVPGATSSKLFGPTESVYLLNLHDASVSPETQTAIKLAITSEANLYLIGMHEAMWIKNAARGDLFDLTLKDRRFLPSAEKFKGLATLFSTNERNSNLILLLLQTKLEEYASILLSRHGQTLPIDEILPDEIYIDTGLIEHIAADFKLSIDTATKTETLPAQNEEKFILAEFIYQVAFRLACRTKKEFSIFKEIDFENTNFLIPPSPRLKSHKNYYTGSRALLTMSQGEPNGYHCYILTKNESGNVDDKYLIHEKDMSLGDRYKYGLLIKTIAPKRYGHRE